MIRQPTSPDDLLAWHRAFMAGQNPGRHDGLPECGWYKTKLVKGGPWVPVTIWCDQEIDPDTGELTAPEVLRADVFGDEKPADEIWTWVTPISREEFDHLYEWRLANQHQLTCTQPVDITTTPTLPRSAL
ncbi:MAG: hypothetical protein ACPGSI_16585 [Pikeienuella sp.]